MCYAQECNTPKCPASWCRRFLLMVCCPVGAQTGSSHLLLSVCILQVSCLQMNNLLLLFRSQTCPWRLFPPQSPSQSEGKVVGRQWHIPAILSWHVTLSRSQTLSQNPSRSCAALMQPRDSPVVKNLHCCSFSGTRPKQPKKTTKVA